MMPCGLAASRVGKSIYIRSRGTRQKRRAPQLYVGHVHTMAKISVRILLAFMLLVITHEAMASGPVLSNQTQKAIASQFGTSDITWSDKVVFRIRNLNTSVQKPFVEGSLVRVRLLPITQVEVLAVFLDGNERPHIVSVAAGTPMVSYIELHAKADKDCAGQYNLVVIQKINGILLANSTAFRTTVGDCGAQ